MTMPSSALPNYIRSFRRGACFSQRELALLVGCSVHTSVSRLERFQTTPDVTTAIGIAFVFGVPLERLFPHLIEDTEDAVARRAYRLLQALEQAEPTVDVLRKREVLSTIPREVRPDTYPSYEAR